MATMATVTPGAERSYTAIRLAFAILSNESLQKHLHLKVRALKGALVGHSKVETPYHISHFD